MSQLGAPLFGTLRYFSSSAAAAAASFPQSGIGDPVPVLIPRGENEEEKVPIVRLGTRLVGEDGTNVSRSKERIFVVLHRKWEERAL